MAIKSAPLHKRRKSGKRQRIGRDELTGSATVRVDGFVFVVNTKSGEDVTTADYYDPSDTERRTEIESKTVHDIVSSENGLTILFKQGLSGSIAKSAMIRIARHLNDKLKVTNEDTKESFTIDQVLNLSGAELSAILVKSELSIVVSTERSIPRHYLPTTNQIEFVPTKSRMASRSGAHPKPIGKLINTGSKPSRQHAADHLPTVNELDRREPEFQGSRPEPMRAGGYRELRNDQLDYHADNLRRLGIESPDGEV